MNEIFDRLTNKWGPSRFTFELSRDEEHYLDDAEFLQKFRRRGYSVSVECVQAGHSVLTACKCCPGHNLTNRRVTMPPPQSPVVGSVITSSPGVMFGIERTTDNSRMAGMRVAGAVDCPRNDEDMSQAFLIPAGAPPPQQVNGAIYVRAQDMGLYIFPAAVPPPALDGAVCISRSDAEGLLRWFERNYPSRRNE